MAADTCRLCLRPIDKAKCTDLMSDTTKLSMLKELFPDLNVDICENTQICNNCIQELEGSYNFKQSVVVNEANIQTKLEENDLKKIDLKLMLDDTAKKELKNDDYVCRTCLSICRTPSISLFDSPSNMMPYSFVKKMCQVVFELEFIASDKPVICDECWETLQNVYNFRKCCLRTDKKLRTYVTNKNIPKLTIDDFKNFVKENPPNDDDEDSSDEELDEYVKEEPIDEDELKFDPEEASCSSSSVKIKEETTIKSESDDDNMEDEPELLDPKALKSETNELDEDCKMEIGDVKVDAEGEGTAGPSGLFEDLSGGRLDISNQDKLTLQQEGNTIIVQSTSTEANKNVPSFLLKTPVFRMAFFHPIMPNDNMNKIQINNSVNMSLRSNKFDNSCGRNNIFQKNLVSNQPKAFQILKRHDKTYSIEMESNKYKTKTSKIRYRKRLPHKLPHKVETDNSHGACKVKNRETDISYGSCNLDNQRTIESHRISNLGNLRTYGSHRIKIVEIRKADNSQGTGKVVNRANDNVNKTCNAKIRKTDYYHETSRVISYGTSSLDNRRPIESHRITNLDNLKTYSSHRIRNLENRKADNSQGTRKVENQANANADKTFNVKIKKVDYSYKTSNVENATTDTSHTISNVENPITDSSHRTSNIDNRKSGNDEICSTELESKTICKMKKPKHLRNRKTSNNSHRNSSTKNQEADDFYTSSNVEVTTTKNSLRTSIVQNRSTDDSHRTGNVENRETANSHRTRNLEKCSEANNLNDHREDDISTNEIKFTCPECQFKANNKYLLSEHLLKHDIEKFKQRKQPDPVEDADYENKNTIQISDKYGSFICPFCPFIEENQLLLSHHIPSHFVKRGKRKGPPSVYKHNEDEKNASSKIPTDIFQGRATASISGIHSNTYKQKKCQEGKGLSSKTPKKRFHDRPTVSVSEIISACRDGQFIRNSK